MQTEKLRRRGEGRGMQTEKLRRRGEGRGLQPGFPEKMKKGE